MKFYFMGICGTAMGNVALLLRSMGHDVIGVDANVYPPMSTVLENAGITVYEGYDASRIQNLDVDQVIVGNVISRGNPEIEWLLNENTVPFCSLPQLLHDTILHNRHNIVITGTHGKTTTTALTAFLLERAGLTPGYLIGGVPKDLPSGSCLGTNTSPFVIEGDEYDSAFFDKRSKFIHYLPKILVINNIEFDHADIFRDLEDVKRTFHHLLRIVPSNGYVLVNGDDPNLESLLPVHWTQVIRVGVESHNDLRITDYSADATGSHFNLEWQAQKWGQVQWSHSGIHNARNAAMAALSVGLTVNPNNPTTFNLADLNKFTGVKRRQEILHNDDDLVVIEDFAHHPTALKETINALKARYPSHRLVACFEPRSYTACRKCHQDSFVSAFDFADEVLIGAVHNATRYSSSDRLDTHLLAAKLNGTAFNSNQELLTHVSQIIASSNRKHLLVFFTNGSFDGIISDFTKNIQNVEAL